MTWTVSGDLDGLPPIIDLIAYRLIQEALTNALKHGTGSATMAVTNRPEGVGIEVCNVVEHDGRQPSGAVTG